MIKELSMFTRTSRFVAVLILLFSSTVYAWSAGGTPVRPQKTKGTATYTVAASDSPAEVIAVADYAADGDADCVTIQAAITALPAAGGKVFCFAGSYLLDGKVTIPSGVTLEFESGNDIKLPADHELDAVGNQYTVNTNTISALFTNSDMPVAILMFILSVRI